MFYIAMKLPYFLLYLNYSGKVQVSRLAFLAWNRWFLNFYVNMIDGFPTYHIAFYIKIYFK